MNRIDRLLGILTFLQSKKYVPAENIATRFGISIRTVYRDIKALNEQGIPISFEAQRGYFVVSGYFLPPLAFSSEEASALLLMETLTQGFSDRSIQQHYSSALHKIKAILRGVQKDQMESLGKNIRTQLPSFVQNNFAFLSPLQESISKHQVIELSYKNQKEEISVRKAEPIGLIFYAFNWHLIAWCWLRKDYRDFRISRIQKVSNTGTPFQPDKHPPLTEFMKKLPVDY